MDYNNTKICLDVFIDHWQQVLYFINITNDLNSLETIFKHIDVMVSIIIKECDEEENLSLEEILNYCAENAIFQTIYYHFTQESLLGEIKEYGMINQLRMYDNLINFLPCKYLMQSNLILTMLHLLEECSLRSSVKIEHLSVHLLYQITVLVTRDFQLFDFIKEISDNDFHEPFYFIGLLIQLIHRDKDIGRLSQEALLLIFNFTKEDDHLDLVDYICFRSDFSAILVTGFSGLYSSFPRKLESLPDDWQQITINFINSVPELKHSLELLDFCNLALKMGHPKIKVDILDFLYTGFLSPVIGPSLHQNSLEETISATAYLELYLRHLHQPLLIKLFLQFILTERQENYVIIDSLINRMNSITMDTVEGMYTLGVITLCLFRTMLSFHSEDVLFTLVFRYLIPCDHLIKQKWVQFSPTPSVEDLNLCENQEEPNNYKMGSNSYNKINEDLSNSAEQFLKLSLGIYSEDINIGLSTTYNRIDTVTFEQRRASQSPAIINNLHKFSMYCPFHSYLNSAALYVNRRILASNCWQFLYDGINPSSKIFEELNHSFEQWNQRFQFSHHKRESNDIIDSCNLNDEARTYSVDSPTEFQTNHNNPVRDVGYYSSNNGSGSTISNRFTDALQNDKKFSYDSSESNTNLVYNVSICKKIYKLNFFNFNAQIKENSNSECTTDDSEKCEDEITNTQIDTYDWTKDVNVQNVLLTTDDDCNLSDFLVSLDLLEVHHYINWDIDWSDVTMLLIQHDAIENIEQGMSTLTSISPVANSADNYQSSNRSTPTNEIIFKRRLQSFDQSMHSSPHHSNFSVTLGPFLSAIFQRLSALPTNTFFMNLLITGILTDLAAYPHPLLKSLLLDIDIILQPHINKLYEILSDVKIRIIEKYSNIMDFESMLVSAYEYLYSRVDMTFGEDYDSRFDDDYELKLSSVTTIGSINSSFFDFDNFNFSKKNKDKKTRRTAFGILKRKKNDKSPMYRFPVQRFCYSRKKPITEFEAQQIRNLAYNWIIFDEFCKELASLCQEHTQHCFF